ncbi:hypothetical protein AB4K20DRAFT_1918657 [Rhizopus microsporus]|uniref:Uncharacterized protein n=1 Tax=Rhizopus microsporus TaxID=58291 RepID=A0A1X0SFD5_RHIZD|nr:hypothetical protein BCV71DRAFT_252550 [Rhizopus microsporus]
MTSSNTRSSRTKKPTSNNIIGDKTKNIKKTKKQLRSKRDNSHHNNTTTPTANNDNQSQQEVYDLTNKYIDPSEHPDYNRLMNELEESKQKKLEKIKIWRDHEKTSVLDWFTAQKKQAWDDYYFARKRARAVLIEEVQTKMQKLRQELSRLNKQSKTQNQEHDYHDWVPPERLHTIGSFVDGATNEEIERDLTIARHPYNGNNTPNLVYSDYESRSTTDTPTEEPEVSLSRTENEPARNHNTQALYLYSSNSNNRPNDRSDWWPFHSAATGVSSTTATPP